MHYKVPLQEYIIDELLDDVEQVEISDDEELLLTGLISSMGVVQLMAFIKDSFGIPVQPRDVTIQNFGTINRIDHFLHGQNSAGDPH